MEASPIALLPFIRTLVMVHFYRHFGAHQITDGTAGALVAIKYGWLVAGRIYFLCNINGAFGTERDAKLTSLTKFLVDLYKSLSHATLHYIFNRMYLTTPLRLEKTLKG